MRISGKTVRFLRQLMSLVKTLKKETIYLLTIIIFIKYKYRNDKWPTMDGPIVF